MAKKAGIDSRTTSPVQNYLDEEMDRLIRLQFRIAKWREDSRYTKVSLPEFFKSRYGEESFQWVGGSENRRYHVWDRPTFRVFVHNVEGWNIEIEEEGATRDKALDAVHQFSLDFGCAPDEGLSGSEIARIERDAIAGLNGKVYEIHRTPDPELIEFVDHLVSGRVYTDKQCRESDVGMVFMPLLFMKPPEEVVKAVNAVAPDPGPEPTVPAPPPPPPPPEKGKVPEPRAKPEIEPPSQIDLEKEESLRRNIEWGLETPEALDAYRKRIEEKNNERGARHAEAVREWEAEIAKAKQDVEDEHQLALQVHQLELEDHAKVVAKHEETVAKEREALAKWKLDASRRDHAWTAAYRHYMKDLGCVWEYFDKAGPRSINGQPIFYSMHFMHIEDWKRAANAANREAERRKNITL